MEAMGIMGILVIIIAVVMGYIEGHDQFRR